MPKMIERYMIVDTGEIYYVVLDRRFNVLMPVHKGHVLSIRQGHPLKGANLYVTLKDDAPRPIN